MKILSFINAAALIIGAIVRFIFTRNYIHCAVIGVSIYMLIFAVCIILTELMVATFPRNFEFLYIGWGKTIYCIMFAGLICGPGLTFTPLDITLGVYFLVVGILSGVISILHRKVESAYVDKIVED